MYDNIQAPGHVLVSRGSKIHKTRNIEFGITQMHFLVYYICIFQKALKNMFKISRFQRFLVFRSKFSQKSPFYWSNLHKMWNIALDISLNISFFPKKNSLF